MTPSVSASRDSASSAPVYSDLVPERVLDAVDSVGLRCDGSLLQLNSFENRVFLLGLDDGQQVVAKFYRPGRWSDEAILEEHAFCLELARREIPAVPPLEFGGSTLHRAQGHRFALFHRARGRAPELEDEATLEWLGRFLGRIHAVGQADAYRVRPALDPQTFGIESRDWIAGSDWLPAELRQAWLAASAQALDGVRQAWERAAPVRSLRLHGDCHLGNLQWSEQGPYFLDFDDSRSGPAVQDLWMLLTGEPAQAQRQLDALLRGYRVFRDFDPRELHLLEALRTLRLLHYSAWIARRWQDPAFPAAFPWFGDARYWEQRVLELREQVELMRQPALHVGAA